MRRDRGRLIYFSTILSNILSEMEKTPIRKKHCTPRKSKPLVKTIGTPVQDNLNKKNKKYFTSKLCEEGLFKLQVSVRVRPPSADIPLDQFCLIKHSVNEISVKNHFPKDSQTENVFIFSYDHIFWFNEKNQSSLFDELAKPLLNSVMEGYNVCLFAYGQTGSGKTYSLMDANGQFTESGMGIIPRVCKELLQWKMENENISLQVSYYEIYNEKIYDLLRNDEVEQKLNLKVREHPLSGPYVADITVQLISTFQDVLSLLKHGNKHRVTGSTLNNERSSRSHAIFDINFIQSAALKSKIRLVDLAGSERTFQCNVTEERFKEGLSINKSLLTLGKVITALSEEKKRVFVPYRESLLTWLLKDCLGGTAKTCMLATVSPQPTAYEETLSTLRWANKAKNIICTAIKNEDPQIKTIIELQNEVRRLQNLRDCVYNPGYLELCTKSNHLNLAEQQKNVETRLQDELVKLEVHLGLAEKEKSELEHQRSLIIQSSTQDIVPQYNSNFYESLKNILNSSLNDSLTDSNATDDFKSSNLSSTTQLKVKYLNKMKHLAECLKSICQTEISLINDNSNALHLEYSLMSEVEEHIYQIIELNQVSSSKKCDPVKYDSVSA